MLWLRTLDTTGNLYIHVYTIWEELEICNSKDWKDFQSWDLLEYVRVRVLYMKKMIKPSVFCTNERNRFCAKHQNFKKGVEFLRQSVL